MSAVRQVNKLIALTLTGAALAVMTQLGARPAGAEAGTGRLCTTTSERGYPDAVPPILPPPPCSALGAIKQAEAQKSRRFSYRLPASARWSDVEMNVYASEGSGY